ncbi:MAG: hypothetical protein HFJ42_01725 [Clostridia bacterium]|nr:hypothetical protein [Clostridia bacterium]
MLLGAISKRFDTIVEFSAFEDFISFDRKGKNKVKRIENHKIKVTIEVGVRIDIWTHFMRECIINYVH